MTTSCPFCSEDIKQVAFLSTAHFHTIYNHAPFLPGHSLVIPKSHISSVFAIPDEQYREFMSLAQSATQVLLSTFQTDAFNWALQEGETAGQTVPHFHLHLLPRYQEDLPDPGDWYPQLEQHMDTNRIDSGERPKLTETQQKKVRNKLRQKARDMFGTDSLADFS